MSSGAWQNISSGTNGWVSVASSYTGQYAIALNNNDTNVWVSSDYGANWAVSSGSPPTSAGWGGVAISNDGTLMAASQNVGTNGNTYNVYLFKNGAWTNITAGSGPGNTNYWTGVAFSHDNLTLAASNGSAEVWLYNITNETWSQCPNDLNTGYPPRANMISSNANGFVCIAFHNWMYTIYGNNTTGFTATTIQNNNSNINTFTPNNPGWTYISSSLDGNTIAACADGDYIYIGTVSNNYWTFQRQTATGSRAWQKVQVGPDAISIVACSAESYGTPGMIWLANNNGSNYIWTQQKDVNGNNLLGDWYSISRSLDNTNYTKFIAVTKNSAPSEKTGIWIYTSYQTASQMQSAYSVACFKEDTKILTNRGYKRIQDLKKGDLVKTTRNGYIAIDSIGKREIDHIASKERIPEQLYKCSKTRYPDLLEDLVLTGCHSILVDDFTDNTQREKTTKLLSNIYVTDNKYRLPACVDNRASVYEHAGTYTIYHFALDSDDYYINFGVYANGLLVETCSQRYMKELSMMTFLE